MRTWYLLAALLDAEGGEVGLVVLPADGPPEFAEQLTECVERADVASASGAPLLVAAAAAHTAYADSGPRVEGLFNGKLEQPLVLEGLADASQVAALGAAGPQATGLPVLHAWDLGVDTDGALVADMGKACCELTLENGPTLAMTGHRFNGSCLDFRHAPEHYGAAHFHDDDIEDAGWNPTAVVQLPNDLSSGVYAVRLETEEETDHIPLCVPHDRRRGQPRSKVAYLVSTMTHLAYANARGTADGSERPDPATLPKLQQLLAAHREWGSATYDTHSDGSGISLSSALRPIIGLRPNHWSLMRDEPVYFGSDLAVVGLLERKGIGYDVLCDFDLHAEGASALEGYQVLVTNPHPEYASEAILDAIEAFQRGGGSVVYLGGNGFYWVTTVSPRRPHVIEIRRGHSGGRAWSSEPGENYHATTGDPGGLWRHRGRAPQRLVGVGFSGVGIANPWPGYRQLPAANDPRAAFLFEGVSKPRDGILFRNAAGNEIDRADADLGTPAHALRLASSEGLHDDHFSSGPEDVPLLLGGVGFGSTDPRVRADIVFYETGFGGAVVSVGSIAWCSTALPANGYDNDVARFTCNALRRLASSEPFTLPALKPLSA